MSTLKVNTLEEATSGGATYFTAKAWVTYQSQTTTAILDSANVSSITDNGTGDFTINFSNAFSSTNYTFSGSTGGAALQYIDVRVVNANSQPTTSTRRIMSQASSGGGRDDPYVYAIFI